MVLLAFIISAVCLYYFAVHGKGAKKISDEKRRSLGHLKKMIENDARIVDESLRIVSTTKKLDTAIMRFDVAVSALNRLLPYDNMTAITGGFNPQQKLETTLMFKDEYINGAILRSYEDTIERAKLLKTERARMNRVAGFFNKVDSFSESLSQSNLDYIERLRFESGLKPKSDNAVNIDGTSEETI